MKFQKLTSISFILGVLVLLLIPSNCFAIVEATDKFYVNDYANVLSDETEKYIFENSLKLYNQTNAQIVVVTVQNLEGKDLESYATELFRSFGIGNKDTNLGLLLLLAIDERASRIEVGDGLEGLLPDGKTGRFQDNYMIPYYKENKFDEGMLNGYKAFFEEVAKEYNYDGTIESAVNVNDEIEIPEFLIILLAYKFIITMIILAIDLSDSKYKWIVFSVLEAVSIFIAYKLTHDVDATVGFAFGFIGTVFNLAAVLAEPYSGYGGYSSGGYSGRSHSYSGGHSYHGGGGRSSGGGSSRHF